METGSRKGGDASGTGGFYEGKDCFHSVYTGEVYLGIIERSIPGLSRVSQCAITGEAFKCDHRVQKNMT